MRTSVARWARDRQRRDTSRWGVRLPHAGGEGIRSVGLRRRPLVDAVSILVEGFDIGTSPRRTPKTLASESCGGAVEHDTPAGSGWPVPGAGTALETLLRLVDHSVDSGVPTLGLREDPRQDGGHVRELGGMEERGVQRSGEITPG